MNRETVIKVVGEILVRSFPNNPQKQRIDESDDKLVFACPFCGDSEVKSSKKRGNLWFESKSYKCFNGGCLIWMPLERFFETFNRKYHIHIPDAEFSTKRERRDVIKVKAQNPLFRFLSSNSSLVKIDDIVSRFCLLSKDEISEDSNAYAFLKKRGLLEIDAPMYFTQADDSMLIFNTDRKSGKTLGYAIRKFQVEENAPKYVLKYYSDLTKIYRDFKVDEETEKDANFLNNYFNILNLDFGKPITAVEGQIDSLFLDNCLATSGLGKANILLDQIIKGKKQVRIFFDRDKDGKKVTMELILKGYSVFLWGQMFQDLKGKYNTNSDLIRMRDIKDVNDLYLFIRSKDPNLNKESFNSYISTFFSTSTYDIIHL